MNYSGLAFGLALYACIFPLARITLGIPIIGMVAGFLLSGLAFLAIALIMLGTKNIANTVYERFIVRILMLTLWLIPFTDLLCDYRTAGVAWRTDPVFINLAIGTFTYVGMGVLITYKIFEKSWAEKTNVAEASFPNELPKEYSTNPIVAGMLKKIRDGEKLRLWTRARFWGWNVELLPYFMGVVSVVVYLLLRKALPLSSLGMVFLFLAFYFLTFNAKNRFYQKTVVVDSHGIMVLGRFGMSREMEWKEVCRIEVCVMNASLFAAVAMRPPGGVMYVNMVSKDGSGIPVTHAIDFLPFLVGVMADMTGLEPTIRNLDDKGKTKGK